MNCRIERLKIRDFTIQFAVVALMFCGDVASAQIRFGCSMSNQSSLGVNNRLTFVPATVEVLREEQRLRSVPSLFGSFNQELYGFQQLEFYLGVIPSKPEPDEVRVVSVAVHAKGEGLDTWWCLRSVDTDLLETSNYRLEDPITVVDPTIPVFLIDYGTKSGGMGTHCRGNNYILFDFRRSFQTAQSKVECCHCESSGYWVEKLNFHYPPLHEFNCAWDETFQDILCEITQQINTDWSVEQKDKRFMLLLSNTNVPFNRVRTDSPANMTEFVQWVASGKTSLGESTLVPEEGPVKLIATLPTKRSGMARYLLGSPCRDCWANFSFYLVDVAKKSKPRVIDVPIKNFVEGGLSLPRSDMDQSADSSFTPTEPVPVFLAEAITQPRKGGPTVLRIMAQEGSAHWVFLVGVEERGEELRVDALRLATDNHNFLQHRISRYPEQFQPVSFRSRPFSMLLEAEREHLGALDGNSNMPMEKRSFFTYEQDEAEIEALASRYALSWTFSEGFVSKPSGPQLPPNSPPRFVVIDSRGQISLHKPKIVKDQSLWVDSLP